MENIKKLYNLLINNLAIKIFFAYILLISGINLLFHPENVNLGLIRIIGFVWIIDSIIFATTYKK